MPGEKFSPSFKAVDTERGAIDSQPASYHVTTDGSTIDAVPQADGLTEYTGEGDIDALLKTLLKDELPPTGSFKEARGKILFKPGDYPGTLSEVPLGSQLTLQGEVRSHYVDSGDIGRPQTEVPVKLNGASGTATFVNPNVDSEDSTFINIIDLLIQGPGASDAGSVAFDSNFHSSGNIWDWFIINRVVTQGYETHYNIRKLDNAFKLLNSHVIEVGSAGSGSGCVFQISGTNFTVAGTNFWTDTQPNALLQIAGSTSYGHVYDCKFRSTAGSVNGLVDVRADFAQIGPRCEVDIRGGGGIGVRVERAANVNVVNNDFRTDTANGQGVKVQDTSTHALVAENTFDGAFSDAIKDNSSGERSVFRDNVTGGGETNSLVIDGGNGLSDAVVEGAARLGTPLTIQNSPTRTRTEGTIYLAGAPMGTNYDASDAGVTIIDQSTSPEDIYRVDQSGAVLGPL